MRVIIAHFNISIIFVLGLLMLTIASSTVMAQEKSGKVKSGFMDPNIYYDTRGHSEFTINALAKFHGPFEYFGFVNYTGAEEDTDVGSFYVEQTLRWKFYNKLPLNLAVQAALRSGAANDSYRLGLRWIANETGGISELLSKLHLSYGVTLFALQAGYGDQQRYLAQIEHAYRFSFWQNKVYISGFADQNLNHGSDNPFTWVTEHQLGIQLLPNFYAVAEYRINEFLTETTGVGLGLEYVMRF
ncbi:hypothetical protein [Fulvivirga lutimaris]|uniref:hypothetical protein n=1 Tax=Fulvivirga lutimaris TaxID=1819566 RepID=UPI0012BBE512|nr:hypothetical protein [Fulvivirga lutimaris]MTI41545.1 hypothetical protein [Fulvivirga lutimaris]